LLQTLAKIYLKAEEAEQAENIIEQALKLADEQKATLRLGKILRLVGWACSCS
jgi:uncharacterized protein HemY